jgi:hypothetical protein
MPESCSSGTQPEAPKGVSYTVSALSPQSAWRILATGRSMGRFEFQTPLDGGDTTPIKAVAPLTAVLSVSTGGREVGGRYPLPSPPVGRLFHHHGMVGPPCKAPAGAMIPTAIRIVETCTPSPHANPPRSPDLPRRGVRPSLHRGGEARTDPISSPRRRCSPNVGPNIANPRCFETLQSDRRSPVVQQNRESTALELSRYHFLGVRNTLEANPPCCHPLGGSGGPRQDPIPPYELQASPIEGRRLAGPPLLARLIDTSCRCGQPLVGGHRALPCQVGLKLPCGQAADICQGRGGPPPQSYPVEERINPPMSPAQLM